MKIKNQLRLLALLTSIGCNPDNKAEKAVLTSADTVAVLQQVFDDEQLKDKIAFAYRNHSLRLVMSEVVRPSYRLNVNNQPVAIVPYDSTIEQVNRQEPPRSYFARVPTFKQLSADKVQVVVVFWGIQRTAIYQVHKQTSGWKIIQREYGFL
ncbi:hypothetical protein [Larkinella soli]|uniref:hypothetical protein n=1 Tax=Larkinella soli TaxID=1770527 RepID=UPI000FFB3883|nr:hypothetical protein [Larkinella soli]